MNKLTLSLSTRCYYIPTTTTIRTTTTTNSSNLFPLFWALQMGQQQHPTTNIIINSTSNITITTRNLSSSSDLSKPLVTAPGKDLSSNLQTKIASKDQELRTEHLKPVTDEETRRKRLIWRSKQRGWLEVDLLLGTWAVENVPKLNTDELDQYEKILNLETVDLFNLIAGRVMEPDPSLVGSILTRLQEYAKSKPVSTPGAYAEVKFKGIV
jgi:succinate dehydrogenase flavin-adding protein (antitoxin of CptAB toxin-antitoxin module)